MTAPSWTSPLRAFLLALAACTLMAQAQAQEWPKTTIKLVVPFPPGGASDIVARLIAPSMSEKLKQSVIVENRPGGGTAIGAKSVITSTDGHTFFVSNSAPISIAPLLFDTPPYDPMKDFSHIGMVGTVTNAFFVSSSVPADTMTQYVAWVKAQGKSVPYGSGGGGSIGHIVGEMFKNELGLQMDHVAYKGSAPMFQDVMGGHILVGVNTLPEVWELAKAGRLKVLAVTSPTRAKIAPNVPSVTELGYGKLVAENFVGLSGPANTPAAVTAKINAALNETLADPKVSSKLEELGFATSKLTPTAFTSFVQKQVTEFNPVVRASGAKLN
jgi:tripartite-type tricarboxylate transporter receptor subunit TctC